MGQIHIDALKLCIEQNYASESLLQRVFNLSYEEACKIIGWMEANNYVTRVRADGVRRVLITAEEVDSACINLPSEENEIAIPFPEKLYLKCLEFCTEVGKVSTSLIQRNFKTGYVLAGKIADWIGRQLKTFKAI